MPIVTHEDELVLAKLDIEVAKQLKIINNKMKRISKEEQSMGKLYQSYTKDLQNLARKMRDKSKQMEILARENRSNVTESDVKDFKNQVLKVDDQIKAIELYYDRTKDLALQKQSIIDRMEEYIGLVVPHSKLRQEIVEIGLRIDKEKNKMVAADSLSKLEDRMKDKQREFDRSKNEARKKWVQVVEERIEVNKMWRALKDCIEDFE